ncbi:putative ATP synthase F0, A subunit [Treponema phagedenis F0421]|uniref:ABC transporter ATP-binding protein n=1 Tax=Treponema phagedenis TaxID=162 RepID=UPI0001F63D45|nr:ABC transporter ATP-binding protein [Treponema phagedenis]EFW37352.1 putative ATP synthase F0, A subunit [Treponema phagedenis F0421]
MAKKEKKPSRLKTIKPYIGNKKGFLVLSLVMSALSAICTIMPMYYIWKIIQELIVNAKNISVGAIGTNAIMAIIFAAVSIVLYFFAVLFSHLMAFEVEENIIKVSMQTIMKKPLGFFDTVESGRVRKVIVDGAAETHSYLAHQLPDLAGTLVSPIVLLVLFIIFDYRLGLSSLLPLILGMAYMSQMSSPKAQALRKDYYESLAAMSSEAVEYVRSIPVVKVFAQSIESFKRFYKSIIEYDKFVRSICLLWKNIMPAYEAIVFSTAFFVVPIALILINGGADIGMILSNCIIFFLVGPTFGSLVMRSAFLFSYGEKAVLSIEKIENMLKYDELEYGSVNDKPLKAELEFKNISFAYSGEAGKVLDNISFHVKEGETYALVGQSGGGKTTIARLASRFWDPDEGEVVFGGRNIKDYTKEALMKNVSFVFQNSKLFKMSIRDNLKLAKKDATDDELKEALRKASALDIVENLEKGLDTIIGTKGTYLSGGETQRIAIARAILKDAPLILLDEATAFADPENEHIIQKSFKELAKGKTTLMIAHRLSSVVDADRILVISGGKIIEEGSHEELLQKGAVYKSMWDEYKKSVDWKIGEKSGVQK